jgi:mycoredoxin
MAGITLFITDWCEDCRLAMQFLRERGVEFEEINIDEEPDAEDLVLQVNQGRRKVPTIQAGGRFFACSPFDPEQLCAELNLPFKK